MWIVDRLVAACAALVLVVTGCTLSFDPSLLTQACAGVAEGSPCMGQDGTCRSGACCTGCWDGTACVDGSRAVACGAAGSMCQTCSAPANTCAAGQCSVERRVVSLSTGVAHTAFVDGLGALWTFGDARPALSRSDDALVGRVGEDGQWTSAAASCCAASFTLAISTDQSLLSCGVNSDGQLGDGTMDGRTMLAATTGSSRWARIAAGSAFGCGVQVDGTLWCWGWNGFSALAQGNDVFHAPSPLQVGDDTDWVTVSTRTSYGCALKQDATLWCWGGGPIGRTSSELIATVEPATSWREVATGNGHACGIRLDGSLYCWGDNASGQLGVPTVTASTLPAVVGTGKQWQHVAAGNAFTCGIQTDGSLWCWGASANGQLGTGEQNPPTVPEPIRVGTRSDWAQISAGERSACGVSRDGLLWCWGHPSEIPFGNVGKFEPTLVMFAP